MDIIINYSNRLEPLAYRKHLIVKSYYYYNYLGSQEGERLEITSGGGGVERGSWGSLEGCQEAMPTLPQEVSQELKCYF